MHASLAHHALFVYMKVKTTILFYENVKLFSIHNLFIKLIIYTLTVANRLLAYSVDKCS